MRLARTPVVLAAFLATGAAATDPRSLIGMSFGAPCYTVPAGKLDAHVCPDKDMVAAIEQNKIASPYASVNGVLTTSSTGATCLVWSEGKSADYQAMEEHLPSMIMVPPPPTTGASEPVPFTFLLPLDQNEGVTTVSGSTGRMVACKFISKEQVAALAKEGTIPASSATTAAAAAAATTTTTTPMESAPAAIDKGVDTTTTTAPIATDEQTKDGAAAPDVAQDVMETGLTSPAAGRRTAMMAAWTLGLGAVVAAFACSSL